MSLPWWNAALLALPLVAATAVCGGKDKPLPTDLPVYPGAKKQSHTTTLDVTNTSFQVQAAGADVKGWYDSSMLSNYDAKFGTTWRTRRELAGMHFDERLFESKTRGDRVKIEVAHVPGKKTAILRLEHCPKSRLTHCKLGQ